MSHQYDHYGTILLKKNQGLQHVYSSQNYGTFYSLYLTFDYTISGKQSEHGTKDIIELKDLCFTIINYKGLFNLGIANVITKDLISKRKFVFKIEVEALIPKREYILKKEKPMMEPIEIDLNRTDIIEIQRELLKMSQFYPDHNPNSPKNLIFDDEFYYRDGLEFKPKDDQNRRLLRPGMEGYGGSVSGIRCYRIKHKLDQ